MNWNFKRIFRFALVALTLYLPSSGYGAVFDPANEALKKADFDQFSRGTTNGELSQFSYLASRDTEVRVKIRNGLVSSETYEPWSKPGKRDRDKNQDLPTNLIEQILAENKGESEWEEPNPEEGNESNKKRTIWLRKDGLVSLTTREVNGSLQSITVKAIDVPEKLEPIILKNPNSVCMDDIEAFMKLIRCREANVATKVLSVEVRKDYIIQTELAYIYFAKERWKFAASEANRVLQIEGLPSFVKEWLGWIIKGSAGAQKASLPDFHIAAATLDDGLLSVRKMMEP